MMTMPIPDPAFPDPSCPRDPSNPIPDPSVPPPVDGGQHRWVVVADLAVGDPAPPMTTGKALAVAIYTGMVAVLAGVPLLLPDVDEAWKLGIALAGLILTAGGAPVIAWLKTNFVTQPVQVLARPGAG